MKTMKRLVLTLIIGMLVTAAVGVVSAQGRGRVPREVPSGDQQGIQAHLEVRNRIINHLGLDPAMVQEQLAAGESLIDILNTNGIDVDTLQAQVRSEVQAMLGNIETRGWMAQERLEERLSHMWSQLERMGSCNRSGAL